MFLVKSPAVHGGRFKTGGIIPDSGIYQVNHSAHRLPHEITLIRSEKFPKCQKCAEAVTFKLLRSVKETSRDESAVLFNVALYELPVLDDGEPLFDSEIIRPAS